MDAEVLADKADLETTKTVPLLVVQAVKVAVQEVKVASVVVRVDRAVLEWTLNKAKRWMKPLGRFSAPANSNDIIKSIFKSTDLELSCDPKSARLSTYPIINATKLSRSCKKTDLPRVDKVVLVDRAVKDRAATWANSQTTFSKNCSQF
jgi:hypothetical protein